MSEMRPDMAAGPIGRQCSASNGPGAAPDCARPTSDGIASAAAAAATAARKREFFIEGSPESTSNAGESISGEPGGLDGERARNLDDVRAGDAVVPRLAFRIPQHP